MVTEVGLRRNGILGISDPSPPSGRAVPGCVVE